LIKQIERTIDEAKKTDFLSLLAVKFDEMVQKFKKIAHRMSRQPEHSADILKVRSLSGQFLHFTGDAVLTISTNAFGGR
jgi:hypothetical protein